MRCVAFQGEATYVYRNIVNKIHGMKHRFMYIYIHMVLKYLSVYIDCRYDLYMIVILYVYLRLKHMYNCILCIYAKAANTQLINDMQYLYVIKCIHVYNIYNINILADIYIYIYI